MTSVTTRVESLFIEDFYDHLMAHKKCLEQYQLVGKLFDASAHLASRYSTSHSGCGHTYSCNARGRNSISITNQS